MIVGVCAALWSRSGVAQTVSFESLLAELVSREAVARVPDPAFRAVQFSSYDRASTGPDKPETWFANNDYNQFVRVEKVVVGAGVREEWVMAEVEEPGAIVRVWSPNPKGTLRVYVDGAARPVIEENMEALLSGKGKAGGFAVPEPLAMTRSRGWNLYLPVPFAKSVKVTSDADGFYYHVGVRGYSAGTVVESFTGDARARGGSVEAILRRGVETLKDPPRNALVPGMPSPLGPLGVSTLDFDAGRSGGAITGLAVRVSAVDMESALRGVVVSMTFDGERTVWVPMGDFFGTGIGLNEFADWYRSAERLGANEGLLRCEWVMPFAKKAVVTFENVGEVEGVSLSAAATVDGFVFDRGAMHFGATWRGEPEIKTEEAKGTKDYRYAELSGVGTYVGDLLCVTNPVAEWWGEGDEKVWVDGETFPSHFGTGTEDYYGFGWCCPVGFVTPWVSQVRVDGRGKNNQGHTVVSRVRSLDTIPFTRSIKVDMEVWHWKATTVAYASTAYWYGRPGMKSAVGVDRGLVKRGVPAAPAMPEVFRIKGATECETMVVVGSGGGVVERQDLGGFGAGRWSGDEHLWLKGAGVGAFVELEAAASPGKHRVVLHATRSWDYGIVRFQLNGEAAGVETDLYSGGSGKVEPTGPIDLGEVEVGENGRLKLRVEVVGKNPGSAGTGSYVGLDAVVIGP